MTAHVRNIAKIWKLTVARIFLSASHITGFHRRHLSALSAIRWVSGVRLAAGRPLVGPSDNCEREAAVNARRDYQPAAHVGGIRLRVARGAECDQAVEMEVRAALGALDDVIIVSPEQIFESR